MGDVRNNLAFKKSVQVLLLAQSERRQRTIAYRFDSSSKKTSGDWTTHKETWTRPKMNHNTSPGPILKINKH
jgi:hypothetical protein